jgi:polyhydroxyalkanoate synthase
MTTDETDDAAESAPTSEELQKLNANLAKIEELSSRFVSAMSQKRSIPSSLQGPSQDLFTAATAAYMAEMVANPAKILEHQIGYWGKTLKHYVAAQQELAAGRVVPPEDPTPKDRRFSNELWETHPYFNFLKQQYLMNSQAVMSGLEDLEGLDEEEQKRLRYFGQQIVDMMSPTNFLGTNPEALSRAVETEGESLVQGLENLVHDIEANGGDVVVTLADKDAFEVGRNIATTEGSVVYRNRLIELIQYAPTTKTVHKTPLVLFPPWINKYYILDLKPQNSLIKWIVDQGFTLFVVSWVNPGKPHAKIGLEDYIEEGYDEAIREAKKITGEDQVNATGYCIAGTLLSLTLAAHEKRKDTSIKSATFFTTLTDFSDQGEFGVFLTDDFVDGIEGEVRKTGYLDSFYMTRTFSYLRSNDLIYSPAIRNYMMGDKPPAFDLLYWNGDSTNLPARMTIEYLRWLCQEDRFARDGINLLGETLKIEDVKVPVCAIACISDHIAAWDSSYRGVQKMGSRSKTFILSGSGHIAGIVNPPHKNKYGYFTNSSTTETPEAWQESATAHEGSWWPEWGKWLAQRSGKKIPARKPGGKGRRILAPAPGTYVTTPPDV